MSSIHQLEDQGNSSRLDPAFASASRRVRRLAARGLIVKAKLKPGILIKPRDQWPKFENLLEMKSLGSNKDGSQVWNYVLSGKGGAAQHLYEECQMTMDPNSISSVLQIYPWHVNSLLTMSDIYRTMGENSYADEFIDRCLYALEMAWPPGFRSALATGNARIKYDENSAPLFQALFRRIQTLGRRGLSRTALETCKMLLQLDLEDPMGARLIIDYYALKAREYHFIEYLVEANSEISLLPNIVYSLALARWHQEQDKAKPSGKGKNSTINISEDKLKPSNASSTETLMKAMLLHPVASVRLQSKLMELNAAHPQWDLISTYSLFSSASDCGSASLSHLVDIFVERHHLLWKHVQVQEWFCEAASHAEKKGAADGISAADWSVVRSETFPPSPENEYQHLRILEFSDAVSRLPPELIHGIGQNGIGEGADLPEEELRQILRGFENMNPENEDQIRESLERQLHELGEMHPITALFRSLLPWWSPGAPPNYSEEDQHEDSTQDHQQ